MQLVLVFILAYLLGSVPYAYILLKKIKNLDIRNEGSGNVGALNSYEVTNSFTIGVAVLLLDLAKGLLAVYISRIIFGDDFFTQMLASIGVVFGHCYSVWLKFKGGRGLATAAGTSVLFAPILLVLWLVFWVVAYLFRKHIHFANITATLLVGLIAIVNMDVLNKYSLPPANDDLHFGIGFALLMLIILSRHIKPLMDYIKFSKNRRRNNQ